MTSDEIRESFLSYFESEGHSRIPSSSLIPVGDPTLLLTTAGMVQFKPYFSGHTDPPNRRLTSTQKSFRAVDIDEVGDSTHLTLFEMLGNFSIGDYFKDDAMRLAIDCLEQAMGISKDRFAVTVHETDDEAYSLWQKQGISDDRIFRFGDKENWWGPAGDEGPTGPCAELHYDYRDERPHCGLDNCGPNCTNAIPESSQVCQRYVELWNLVFMQFYQDSDGTRKDLPNKGIDTGMGLERLATVKQNVMDVYETDLFTPLIRRVEELSGKPYLSDADTSHSVRVVVEHIRSASFLVADGVVPGNEGRGYVLRRIVRRAIRHGRRLGLQDVFLGELADVVVNQMGPTYPELLNHREFVMSVLSLEEERFLQVFQKGLSLLTDELKDVDKISGEVVFRLWDTYGFPLEITQEIAGECDVAVDVDGFQREMQAQKDRARASAKFGGDMSKIRVYQSLGISSTSFLGYDKLLAPSVVVGLIVDGVVADQVQEGSKVEVVLQDTPFYPEGGGQVGDTGQIVGESCRVDLHDTQMVMDGLIVHFGIVTKGIMSLGDKVDSHVDVVTRQDTARNHTATHLLHAALRQTLGPHVRQAGSLVAPERLRFDFSHVEPMTSDDIEKVQWLVNEKIRQNATVHRSEDSYSSAINRGALAFFGDKYDENVRLVEISNGATFSFEVCGGTHVDNTGELGTVYILGESSIGAGIRRIEAVSGRGAERILRDRLNSGTAVASLLQTNVMEMEEKVSDLLEELDELRQKNQDLDRRLSLTSAGDLLKHTQDVCGTKVLAVKITVSSVESMREVGDWLRDKMQSGVLVLGSVIDNRPVLTAMVTQDIVDKGVDASAIVRKVANVVGGGGGGRPDVAQAGGKNPEKLDDALGTVPEIIRDVLGMS
tara:strand:- start:1780 stop:4434 length:2655 start_codon:yes stop_codon:yes gene_type:complete